MEIHPQTKLTLPCLLWWTSLSPVFMGLGCKNINGNLWSAPTIPLILVLFPAPRDPPPRNIHIPLPNTLVISSKPFREEEASAGPAPWQFEQGILGPLEQDLKRGAIVSCGLTPHLWDGEHRKRTGAHHRLAD